MNEREIEKIKMCFQEMVDTINSIANYEMETSRLFYFLKMAKYEKYFEKLAIKHFSFLEEMLKFFGDYYGIFIVVAHEDNDNVLFEYDSMCNIELNAEEIKEIVLYLIEHEKSLIDRCIKMIDKVKISKTHQKEYKIKKVVLTSMKELCCELDKCLEKLECYDMQFWFDKKHEIEVQDNSYKLRGM